MTVADKPGDTITIRIAKDKELIRTVGKPVQDRMLGRKVVKRISVSNRGLVEVLFTDGACEMHYSIPFTLQIMSASQVVEGEGEKT